MLDLKAIFDPDGPTSTERVRPAPAAPCLCISTPADLPADWRIEWEERAAIREYDGVQHREHAEAEALREIIDRMRTAGEYPGGT